MKNLFADYIAGIPELETFYGRSLRAPFAFMENAPKWDEALVHEINDYQARLGGSGVVAGNELAVVTGQQPATFTGPLYTIYKAITAIRLAGRVQQDTGRPCIPIFWIGSDDHDFEEARSAHFLTKTHEPLTLHYAPSAPVGGLPMFRVPIEDSLHEQIDQAANATPGSEFRAEVTEFLHDALSAADSLSDWSARLLARVFRDTPLVLFSPHLARARQVAAPAILHEIAAPLTSTRLLNASGDRLEALGYSRQIIKSPEECGFFLEFDGYRRRVHFDGARYVVPEQEIGLTVDEMLALADTAPERFSANVAMRCIVQQRLFPTVAYVGGPGEVAYWAQFKAIFDEHKLAMPLVYPRAQCVLTTSKLSKLMNKFGFTLGDLDTTQDTLLDRALRISTKNPALEVLKRQRPQVESALNSLAAALSRFGAAAPWQTG